MTRRQRRTQPRPPRFHLGQFVFLGLVVVICGGIGFWSRPPATPVKLIWEFRAADAVLAAPAVGPDWLYVGADDGNTYALEKDSGRLVWKFFRAYPMRASPVVAHGLVYVGCGDGHLYALDAGQGQVVWDVETQGPVEFRPVIEDNVLYFADDAGVVQAVDARTRTPRWPSPYVSPSAIAHSLAVAGSRVFLANRAGQVVALAADTGEWDWTADFSGALLTEPVAREGMVYIGADLQGLPGDAFNGLTGADTRGVYALAQDSGKKRQFFPTESAVTTRVETDGQWLCCGTAAGVLYCFHQPTAQLVWQFPTEGPLHAPPLLVDQTLYCGSNDGCLYALDVATGALRWRLRTQGEITAGCATDAQHIYFASWSGEIGAVPR